MGSTGNSTGIHLHFVVFDKISSSPFGYGKAPSNGVAKDSTGRKFFDPLKVIESNGESIKL